MLALKAFADGAVFAQVFGEGPPEILALHGWGRRGADFRRSLHDRPALVPDLPGFGASPPPNETLGTDGYASIVAELLPVFDRPPVLVGHSFGGRIGVCLAAKKPDAIRKAVLTGVPLLKRADSTSKGPDLGYRVWRSLNKAGIVSDDRLEAEKRSRGSADYRAATGVMRDILVKVVNETYESELARIEIPVTMVWGDNDSEVPVEVAERAAGMLRQVRLEVLPGVGHLVPTEAPDVLRDAVDRALQ